VDLADHRRLHPAPSGPPAGRRPAPAGGETGTGRPAHPRPRPRPPRPGLTSARAGTTAPAARLSCPSAEHPCSCGDRRTVAVNLRHRQLGSPERPGRHLPRRSPHALSVEWRFRLRRSWPSTAPQGPTSGGEVAVDRNGVPVVAHAEKQEAAPAWKKTYGHHPLTGFVDHGPGGTGESAAALPRPGNAGSDTAAGHVAVTSGVLPRPDDSTTRPEQWNPAPTQHVGRATGLPTINHGNGNGLPTPSADRHARSRPAATRAGTTVDRVRQGPFSCSVAVGSTRSHGNAVVPAPVRFSICRRYVATRTLGACEC